MTVAGGLTASPNVSDVIIEGKKVAFGTTTPTDGNITVATGLSNVDSVVASFDGDPVITCLYCHATVGDQAGSPAAGSVNIITEKPTAVDNATPIAATTPFVDVNWIAVGDE